MDASEQNLYNTLGVDENASAANITAAYRRLSRTYHPDRWLEPEEKREASKRWLGISAAYDVLADDRKRMTYDTLGPDQFALGLQVLNDTVRGPDDLRRAVQKVKRRSAEQEHQGKLRLSGATVITASVDDLSPASAARWFGAELQSVAMSQEMALELDSRSTLSLGPQLLTKARPHPYLHPHPSPHPHLHPHHSPHSNLALGSQLPTRRACALHVSAWHAHGMHTAHALHTHCTCTACTACTPRRGWAARHYASASGGNSRPSLRLTSVLRAPSWRWHTSPPWPPGADSLLAPGCATPPARAAEPLRAH